MAVQRKIVVGVRDPDDSAAALEFAFGEAALRKSRILALNVWPRFLPGISARGTLSGAQRAATDQGLADEPAARLEAALAGWRQKYPDVPADWEVVHAHTGHALVDASARADLVVLGRHDHHGRAGVGCVMHAVLGHAHSPVVCVPGGSG